MTDTSLITHHWEKPSNQNLILIRIRSNQKVALKFMIRFLIHNCFFTFATINFYILKYLEG